MVSITQEHLEILRKPFELSQHEFLRGMTYLTESAITTRIEDVDPAWTLETLSQKQRGDQIITTVRLTILGAFRDGTGMESVKQKNDGKGEANEAEKASATDALKRAARLFGIGRYLLDIPKDVKDEAALSRWLGDKNPQPWANAKNLDFLYAAAQKQFPSISKPEFLKAAGIDKWTDYDAWAQTYPTGQAASNAIMQALTTTPPSPNGNGHKSAFAKKSADNPPLHDNGEGPGEGSTIAQDLLITDGDPVTPPKHMSEVDF